MKNTATKITGTRYAAFDKRTGRVVGMHSRVNAKTNDYVEVPHHELRAMWSKDSAMIEDLTDHDISNLGIIQVGSESHAAKGPVMVDVARGLLVPQPRLSLTADKHEIQGDGKDRATIKMEVVDADGKRMRGFGGRVKVTTTRGKLSTPGGVVDLADGAASLTLTSVPETVSKVRVQASVTDALCGGGYVTLEFI